MRSKSLHRYNEKKKWKWTTGKVVAFVFTGLIIGGIIYLELTMNNPTSSPTEEASPDVEVSSEQPSFEQQYQEYLKRGRKVIDQSILDSLDSIAQLGNEPSEQPNPTPQQPNTPSPSSGVVPAPSNTNTRSEAVSNRNNSGERRTQYRLSDNGEIEEGAPDRQPTASTQQPAEEPDTNGSIEEAFYTAVAVTGTVTSNSDGAALSGVNVMVKGTNISTVTDFNGKYEIQVPGNPDQRTLQFSYRGNLSERLVRPETKSINIRF